MIKKFEERKKKRRLQGHFYRPFADLEKTLREKGLYPKGKKKS